MSESIWWLVSWSAWPEAEILAVLRPKMGAVIVDSWPFFVASSLRHLHRRYIGPALVPRMLLSSSFRQACLQSLQHSRATEPGQSMGQSA